MRAACLLLTLACVPVFAQEAIPVSPPLSVQRLQSLKEKLFPNGLTVEPRDFVVDMLAGGTCSIPLLNAGAPGTPVKMPNVAPPKGQGDRMMPRIVPAPACPSNMAHVGAPALPPPAPRKP